MKLDDILALPDVHDRVQRLFVRLIPLAQEHRFATMPPAAQRFFAVVEWLGEVKNGGAHQYFSNSSGDRWQLALASLDAIGDVEGSKALRAALTAFPASTPSENRWQRHDALDALDPAGADALKSADRAVATTRSATFEQLAKAMERDKVELRFIDGYPSGLKAIDVPSTMTMAGAMRGDDPFAVVTNVYAIFHRDPSESDARTTFLDAFAVLDEVSVGGFVTYLTQTQAGRRWREAVKALHTIGVPAHAALLERAAAAHAAGEATFALDGEHQDGRTALATALAQWITHHR